MMPTTIMTKESFILELIEEFSRFPESELTPIGTYDTAKLVNILREKEVIAVCDVTKEDFELANQIDISFGAIVKDIVSELNLDESFVQYLEREREIENLVHDDLYIYTKQAALSVKALYYYKKGQTKKSISTTLECIVLNEYLIKKGITTLNLRCFEQNKNISRILLRDKKLDAGYQLIYNLLNYLFNGIGDGLYGNIFIDEAMLQKAPILRETYGYELFSMIAEDMIRFNIRSINGFLPNEWYINLDFDVTTPARQVIYNWIYVEKQLQKRNYEEYFISLKYFFSEPSSVFYDILKVYLIIDLLVFANSQYANHYHELLTETKDFVAQKLKCNDRFKHLVLANIGNIS